MAAEENKPSALPDKFNKELITSFLQNENIVFNTVRIKKIAASRFFSSLYSLQAQSDANKPLNVYIKCLPEDDEKLEITKAHLQFQNEMRMYRNIIPSFETFQRRFSQHSRPPLTAPQCYAAEGDGKNNTIILQDMNARGFIQLQRLKSMGIPEISLAMKEIGRFHGFSIAMKIQEPEEFKKMTGYLVEPMYQNPQYNDFYRKAMSSCLEDVLLLIKDSYKEGNTFTNKYETFLETAFDVLPSFVVTDPSNEPFNCILHGDVWVSNMLFVYSKDTSKPQDVCFLDFQQCRYGSPAIDICRFLYVMMDKATRETHGEYLLHCYHDGLKETLNQFHQDHEYLFPFSEVKSQLRKYSVFVVGISIFTLVYSMCESEDEDFSDGETITLQNSNQKIRHYLSSDCRRKVFEVIEEFAELGYLDRRD